MPTPPPPPAVGQVVAMMTEHQPDVMQRRPTGERLGIDICPRSSRRALDASPGANNQGAAPARRGRTAAGPL
jgi:hypothetical protein